MDVFGDRVAMHVAFMHRRAVLRYWFMRFGTKYLAYIIGAGWISWPMGNGATGVGGLI